MWREWWTVALVALALGGAVLFVLSFMLKQVDEDRKQCGKQ